MFKLVWEFVFRKLPIVKQLDGQKTKISALLIVFTYAVMAVTKIAPLFPQYLWLADLHVTLVNLQSQILDALNAIGWGTLVIGLADKEIKATK